MVCRFFLIHIELELAVNKRHVLVLVEDRPQQRQCYCAQDGIQHEEVVVRLSGLLEENVLKDDHCYGAQRGEREQEAVKLSSLATKDLLENVWSKHEVTALAEHKHTDPDCVEKGIAINKEDRAIQDNLRHKQSAIHQSIRVVVKRP